MYLCFASAVVVAIFHVKKDMLLLFSNAYYLDAIQNCDVVIHCAGKKYDPKLMDRVNVEGTRNIVDAAISNKAERFIHIGSVGIIGANPLCKKRHDEDASCHPNNAYGKSKWTAEIIVKEARSKGLNSVILRPANVFGDLDPQCGMLTLLKIIRAGRFAYIGGRQFQCNYVYVEDVAHAIVACLDHPNALGQTYHLSDSCTVGEFVDHIADTMCAKQPVICLPSPGPTLVRSVLKWMRSTSFLNNSAMGNRLAGLNNLANFSSCKIKNELGFDCPVGWKKGIQNLIHWYRRQGLL